MQQLLACSSTLAAAASHPGWHLLRCALSSRCLSTGTSFSLSRVVTQQDVDAFVQLTGDSNPIHTHTQQQQQHESSPQHQPAQYRAVVPGMLMASMFPAIIGSQFPGAMYLSQTLKFRQPAAVGCAVSATVTVSKQSGSRVTFYTVCTDADRQVLVDGTALALISPSAQQQCAASAAQPEAGS